MTKIKNTVAYVIKTPLALTDYAIGTNSEDNGVGMAKGQSISMQMVDIRNVVIAGLSPEIGGTLKITELEYTGVLTSPADVANNLDPVYIVSPYEVLMFNVNGNKYLLKLQDVTIGDGEPDIANSDFITIVAIKNLGDGTAVMSGYNADGEIEFRSLKSTGLDISVSSGNIVIESKAGTSVGDAGVDVYKGLNVTTKLHEIRKAKSVGFDVTIDGDSVKYESKAGANVGASGQGVYKALNPTTKIHEFYKFLFPDFDVVLADDIITVSLPADPSDVKFYVNANYQGGDSNGSLARPYVTLKEAYDRYIGTGDVASPQFATIGTIELLSDVETGQTGDPDEIGYLSANSLRIKGNGYKITYRGTQEYFISTAYLITQVGLDGSNALNQNISMSFEDLTITSNTVHEIVEHKNYTSPSIATSQNTCGMTFTNCVLEDKAYLEELGSYTTLAGVTVFGVPVKYQTALASDKYLVRNEDVNWTGEGNLILENVSIKASSSTAIYAKNTKCFWKNVEINFNPFFVNSGGIVSTKCTPKNDVFSVFIEGTVISQNYFRIENYSSQVQYGTYNSQQAGGQGAIVKTLNNCFVEIFKGFVYFETMTNVFLISKDTLMSPRSFDGSNITSLDATYGAFKLSGTAPVSQMTINISDSIFKNVFLIDANVNYIKPYATTANVNTAQFTSLNDYVDDAGAIAVGGLIVGNIYYNTTDNCMKKVE